ncbi:hypothetical protein KI387_032656 [Taxus chinensis]|uniref:Transcription factor CBF/NF-Y/archaeal histone domain-containing protein n=1 Tax=Taxus chinensis TaxID=29808 RepID=A0AA38C074_TAXCH|nr:hypothetical protein KI387_032656 [Taxus chinensis]
MSKEILTISDSSSQSTSDFSEEGDHGEEAQNFTEHSPHVAEEEQPPNPASKTSHNKIAKPDGPASMAFPMARVRRLIKSEEDIRISLEAAFLVNKATERFLEQFIEDTFEYVPEENRNILCYKQLSLAVANQKRYEFLAGSPSFCTSLLMSSCIFKKGGPHVDVLLCSHYIETITILTPCSSISMCIRLPFFHVCGNLSSLSSL